MKRSLFYIILAAAIIGSTVIVLLVNEWSGYKLLDAYISGMIKGDIKMGTSSVDFHVYSLIAFLLINAGVLLAMLLLCILSKFRLGNIRRFYRISIWFLISAALVTGTWLWMYFDMISLANKIVPGAMKFNIKDLLPYQIVPMGSALLACLLGLIFYFVGRRQ